MSPTCKGCGAIIHWLTTRAGKPIPVDPERLTEYLVRGQIAYTTTLGPEEAKAWAARQQLTWPLRRLTLITPEGDTVCGYQGSILTPHAETVVGYVPHWASCAQAAAFKR